MELAKIVLLCIVALCGYGGALGAVSALVCPEAFTLGRPPSFANWPPVALGAIWGTLDFLIPATAAGLGLAMAAQFGPRPAVKASFFPRVAAGLVVILTVASVAAAAAGYVATQHDMYRISGPLKQSLPIEKHPGLAAVWWASLGAMLVLFAVTLLIAGWLWRKRAYFEELLRNR